MTEETGQTPWIRERDAVVERMLAGGGRPGIADPALRSGKTGLELLQAMLRGELPFPPIAETLDFSLISVEAGNAVFQGTPQFKHYNPLGYVARLGARVRRAEHVTRGVLVHDSGAWHEYRACRLERHGSAARNGQRRTQRAATGDRRRADCRP